MRSFPVFVLYCSLTVSASGAFSQVEEPKEAGTSSTFLGLSVGINDFHQRDNYLSPHIFDGINFSSKLAFQTLTEDVRHRVDAFFSLGALNADIAGREVTEKGGGLSYSFALHVHRWDFDGSLFQLSLGGGLSSFALNTDFNTTDETGYTKLDQSWYWLHSLNLVLPAEYRFNRGNSLTLQVTLPVVQLVSRPENGHRLSQANLDVVDDDFLNAATQGEIQYIWDSLVLIADVEYRHSLSNHVDLLAAYRFAYVSSDRPASLLSLGVYMNTLTAGIGCRF